LDPVVAGLQQRDPAARKQSFSPRNISYCVSLRSYMLDVLAVLGCHALFGARIPIDAGNTVNRRRPKRNLLGTDRLGEQP
jgi:hypothetical protein